MGCDDIHIWRTTLDRTPPAIQKLLSILAVDERARADRFHFERDRNHFIVARAVLRAVLGGYLNQVPERLIFRYGAHGKPALAEEVGGEAIRFNVSHSRGEALYAVTRGREVGIDLERVRSDLAVAEIAARFFSVRETAALRALPIEARPQAFFRIWTRKEALVKARGGGLSLPLNEFEVSLDSAETVVPRGASRESSDWARWSIRELDPAPGYAAALAMESQGCRLALWQWPAIGRQLA